MVSPAVFFVGFVLVLLWNIAAFTYLHHRRKKNGPSFDDRAQISFRFDERGASGRVLDSPFTRYGGASNVLRVSVSHDELWVSTYFPFSGIAHLQRLEQRLRIEDLKGMEKIGKRVRVSFIGTAGRPRTIELRLKRSDAFVHALGA